MKTEAITQQIINNYKKLSKLSQIQAAEKNTIPIWGLVYKQNGKSGFVSQLGMVECNRSSIQILNENELRLGNKPIFMSARSVLKNINTMLKNIIENINNSAFVTKREINVQHFPEDKIEKLIK